MVRVAMALGHGTAVYYRDRAQHEQRQVEYNWARESSRAAQMEESTAAALILTIGERPNWRLWIECCE